jgi:hypothetical protein
MLRRLGGPQRSVQRKNQKCLAQASHLTRLHPATVVFIQYLNVGLLSPHQRGTWKYQALRLASILGEGAWVVSPKSQLHPL